MDANDLNLMSFLGQRKVSFVIPVYQRNYDWKREHCKQLLEDIIQCGHDDNTQAHFLGSIVFIHNGLYSMSKIKELTIIDGQQRLTTLTLIWIVIYKLAQKLKREDLVEEIYESYIVNKRDGEKLKLRPTENNDGALRHIISPTSDEEFKEFSRVVDNFDYFSSAITEENLEVVLKGLDKLMFVEISLERGKDDPQRIFESLNSTGLDLSQADLIRNYILMGLEPNKQREIYDKYWKSIERLAKDESTKENYVSDFIRDFLTLKNKTIPNKNKVYKEFKAAYKFNDEEEFVPILKKLKEYAGYYNRLVNTRNEYDRDIRKYLDNINKLEIKVAYPFLLQVYADYRGAAIEKSEFIKILRLVETFSWRRFIAGVPTNALNKVFMRLYDDVDTRDYYNSLATSLAKKTGTQRLPKDAEILTALHERDIYNTHNRNRTFLFENLENFENREYVNIEGNSAITIEHIFPQTPSKGWKKDLGDLEYRDMGDVYLHTLANLTLSGNNGNLGNKIFTEKRDLPEKGYKHSRLFLNRYLSEINKWGIKELEERYQILSKRFLKIWPYPDVQVGDKATYEEVNIFDAEDPTNKKLAYAIFLDKKIHKRRISYFYVHIFSELFSFDPKRFFATNLAERVGITKKAEELNRGVPINESYYIEANLSSTEKFSRIKDALAVFEFTDDLYIKYES